MKGKIKQACEEAVKALRAKDEKVVLEQEHDAAMDTSLDDDPTTVEPFWAVDADEAESILRTAFAGLLKKI